MNIRRQVTVQAARTKAFVLYADMVADVGAGICFACGNPAAHEDHVFPTVFGGRDEPWNWQPLCAPCNQGKGARHATDWRPEPFRSLMRDISMQTDVDMSADGRWLTYDQLAKLRHIDKPSAVKLATRNRWPRRKGNARTNADMCPNALVRPSEGPRRQIRG